VDDVSFDLARGETLGIVGESGCGKTVTSKTIMRLLPERTTIIDPRSQVMFEGINLASADARTMRKIRGDRIAMIFQEPMTSLNPVFTVGWQIEEALKYHKPELGRGQRKARAIEMLKLVEIPEPQRRYGEYPHQLSGGMRQRVMIAIALCCEPDILIADEPTTALDVTIQAQILALMDGLKKKLGTAIVLITHNLGVVAQVCDRVMVMYAGRVIEVGTVWDIFHRPRHPYTRAMLDSIPKAGRKEHGKRLPTIEGIVPSLFEIPPGCRFQDRCKYKQDRCAAQEPALLTGQGERGAVRVRCHFPLGEAWVPVTVSGGGA
jgi:oligopeptide/dipeptide ABC transporter ATP-binding protein